MKRLIKNILKEESFKQTLKQEIKKFGWEDTASLVGGREELVKTVFNNDPMEYLNMFNDLDVVKSEEQKNWILFRYVPKYNMMTYSTEWTFVGINYEEIWSFLMMGFSLDQSEIERLIQKLLSEVYNIKGVDVVLIRNYTTL
jgi:hypothetical protein